MVTIATPLPPEGIARLRAAAHDQAPVAGLTHGFYRYPARFSPNFARTCIDLFSKPGDTVLDPYMGGGTTVLEAMAAGRRAIGTDLNSLSVFIAGVKVARLTRHEDRCLRRWALEFVPSLRCADWLCDPAATLPSNLRNMSLPSVRWIKKTIAQCIEAADAFLPTLQSKAFARCVLLNVGQWALNGKKRLPDVAELRARITDTTLQMLAASMATAAESGAEAPAPLLRQLDAEYICDDPAVRASSPVDLVVTSPPYPGIHVLYHRWQVDGRKESNAPYWIAACSDGRGAAYYNFADRKDATHDGYFGKAMRSFRAVRQVMKSGAVVAQLVAFAERDRHLPRYLATMSSAGFTEIREPRARRIWREVPGRRWHANSKGATQSSREVVLVHIAS